jgi:hypothetical protein
VNWNGEKEWLVVTVILLLFIFTSASLLAQEIPEGARVIAERNLDDWRKNITANPSYHFLPDNNVNLEYATIEGGYTECHLFEDEVLRYTNSSDLDPTKFSLHENYVFVVTINKEHIASFVISTNYNRDGEKYDETQGEYFQSGSIAPDSRSRHIILPLIRQYPPNNGFAHSYLKMTAGDAGVQFLVRSPDNELLIAPINAAAALALNVDYDEFELNLVPLQDVVVDWKSGIKERIESLQIHIEPR